MDRQTDVTYTSAAVGILLLVGDLKEVDLLIADAKSSV